MRTNIVIDDKLLSKALPRTATSVRCGSISDLGIALSRDKRFFAPEQPAGVVHCRARVFDSNPLQRKKFPEEGKLYSMNRGVYITLVTFVVANNPAAG